MSAGVVDWSGLNRLGVGLAAGLEQSRTQDLASLMGAKVSSGDYAGAAKTAFDAGDLQTGLKLVALGEDKKSTADFQSMLGGAGGIAGILGGGTPAPATPAQPVTPAGGLPSFTDASGPAGSYLATLRGKESGGSATAKNPNSSATGIDQFTSKTWEGLRKKYPELGLTPDGRTDVAQSTRAMEKFTADNARVLTSAGVPITPGNLYVAHFLGAGGASRFIQGTMNNPDAPATAYVAPDQVAANRTIFYNRDGSPKSAGAVYAERTSKFGGATPPAAVQAQNPARVRVASADPSFVPQAASPATGASPSPAGPTMAIPDDPVPAEQRVQVAQAAPQVFQQAGLNPQAAAQLQATQPGSRARVETIIKFMSHPKAPEGFKDSMKAVLANELAIDKENRQMTPEQKAYYFDVAQGFRGDTMAWRAQKAAAERAPDAGPVDVQKYEYAKKQGYSGTLVDFLKTEAEARSTKISNTVTNKGDTAEEVELAKGRVADAGEYQKAGQAASARQVDIDALRTLSRQLGLQGAEAGLKEALAPYAQSFGVKLDGIGDIQAYSSIIKKLTPNMRPPGSGATSDFEQKLYEKALPGLLQVPETRELVMDMISAANEGEIKRGQIAEEYRLNGDKAKYARELMAVPKPLDMFKKFRTENPTLFEQADKLRDQPGRALPKGQRDAAIQLKAAPSSEVEMARAAIQAGTPAEKVMAKMRARGFDPSGL